jgi:quinol monooxygenase YgiN
LDTPVRMTVQWHVSPQESGPITSALHAMMIVARAEPGCVSCHLSTEMGNHAGLRYIEEWKEEGDLKRQLRSDRFTRLAELMERAVDAPRIEFSLPGGTRGMDYAVEVRERNGESR